MFYNFGLMIARVKIGKYYPIKIILNFALSFFKRTHVEIDGYKMSLDKNDSLCLSIFKKFEPEETDFVKHIIKQGYTVLDIGANIGYYTLMFSKLVGPNGKIYAFEPDPENFAILKENIASNKIANVIAEQKAVSDKSGPIRLFKAKANLADHRIYDPGDKRDTVDIQSVSIDDYFNGMNEEIDFIKMDIEGAEGGALKGMEQLLKRHHEIKLMTEFYPSGLRQFGICADSYLSLLAAYGFEIYELGKSWEKVSKEYLLSTYTPEKDNFTNLLCVKK